ILEELRIFGKDRALFGVIAVRFQGHQAFLASAGKQLVQHFHGFQVFGSAVLGAAKDTSQSCGDFLQDEQRVGNQHRANGRAEDDQQLGGLQENEQVAVLHQV